MIGHDHRCTIEIDDGAGWTFWRRHETLQAAVQASACIAGHHQAVRVRRRNETMAEWHDGARLSTFDVEALRVQQQGEKAPARKPPYVPPSRPPVVERDPWTGRLVEFEVVFDGR